MLKNKPNTTLTARLFIIILMVSTHLGLYPVRLNRQVFLYEVKGMSGMMSCSERAGAVPRAVDSLIRHAFFIAFRKSKYLGGSNMESKNFIDYIDTIDATRAKVDLLFSVLREKSVVDYQRRGKEGVDLLMLEVSTTLEEATMGLMETHREDLNKLAVSVRGNV